MTEQLHQLTKEQRRQRREELNAELREIHHLDFRDLKIHFGIDPDKPAPLTRREAREKIDKLRRVTVKRGASEGEAQNAEDAIRRLEAEHFPHDRLRKTWREVSKIIDAGDARNKPLFQARLRKLIAEANELLAAMDRRSDSNN
jgi:hypothetical protein